MKYVNYIFLLTLFILISDNVFSQEFTCRIKGSIIDRDNKEILIAPITEDFNNITILHKGIKVPINNNKFEYDLTVNSNQAYLIIFMEEVKDGSGYRIREFFPDSSVVEINIYANEENNEIIGGKLNRLQRNLRDSWMLKYKGISEIQDSLRASNKWYREEYMDLKNKIYQTEDMEERAKLYKERRLLNDSTERYTAEAYQIVKKEKALAKEYADWRDNYIKTNINIYTYSLLYSKSESNNKDDFRFISSVYPKYASKYPDHPYTKLIAEKIKKFNTLVVGGHYFDFKAPTIDGKIVTISDSIKGNVALIDLWSTWCGPCRYTAKSMIPIYEKYKDKGFTVIGVCGVYKDMNQYHIAVENDKYPWLNLVEFNNQNGIWSLYNKEGSGGGNFLVDTDGKILAISPNAKEVEEILSNILK